MKTPQWAQDLIIEACIYLGLPDTPAVTWHKSKQHKHSSGRAWQKRIHVTAGSSRQDQKLVVLHEMAHVATPKEHHSTRFWEVAIGLYLHFKVSHKYIIEREKTYRANFLEVAEQMGLRGSKKAIACKRKQQKRRKKFFASLEKNKKLIVLTPLK